MISLTAAATDAELIAYIDAWAELLERGEYATAFAWTGHDPDMGWTPALMKEVIAAYGQAGPGQKVTVHGVPTDIKQRKKVIRWPNAGNIIGEIWYDLNIDGMASDLTATFSLVQSDEALSVELNDIHVM